MSGVGGPACSGGHIAFPGVCKREEGREALRVPPAAGVVLQPVQQRRSQRRRHQLVALPARDINTARSQDTCAGLDAVDESCILCQ